MLKSGTSNLHVKRSRTRTKSSVDSAKIKTSLISSLDAPVFAAQSENVVNVIST